MSDPIDQTARHLQKSHRVLIITGAGISADSGLPTYRGIGGLYSDAHTEEGLPIETLLSGHMLNTQPGLCWKYISQIEAACRGAQPNTAHNVITRLQSTIPEVWVLTQNVDNLHQLAGNQNLIEIHGNLTRLFCTQCDAEEIRETYANLPLPPRCPRCSGLVRPGIVLFGEALPHKAVTTLEEQLSLGFDLILSVGTSSGFPYIAAPVLNAHSQGLPTVEINPDTTEVSPFVSIRIRQNAAAAFEELWRRFEAL